MTTGPTLPDAPRGAHAADRLATNALCLVLSLAIVTVIVGVWLLTRTFS